MAICTHEELLTMRCGRGLTKGVVSVREWFVMGVVLWVWLLRTINNLYLCFVLSRKFFFEGKDTQKHRTRWVGETW